jgi:hypothetical protein
MGSSGGDNDDGYDRSDEADDFRSWSNKKRAASAPAAETPPEKPPAKTLTERLADAAADREEEGNADSQ